MKATAERKARVGRPLAAAGLLAGLILVPGFAAAAPEPQALTVTVAPAAPDLVKALPPEPTTPALLHIRALGIDPAGIIEAIAAYRADKLDAGDAIAAKITDPLVRSTLEWVALREVPQKVTLPRLEAFAAAHPAWPARTWLRHEMEARLPLVKDPVAVEIFFTTQAPETPIGKLALARALKANGRVADGTRLARAVFRESDPTSYGEGLLRAEFGTDLTKADFKYRADRLLYKGRVAPALRAAAQAGPDVLALAKARGAVIAESPSDAAIAAVPEALRKDPGLILARVQKLRRADKPLAAAYLMETAPHDARALVDGDEWWMERRALARDLLDAGKINAAYVMCAMATPTSREATIEAEFHAGWIALRYMSEPRRAAYHFDVAARLAETPTSLARIAYWQGRTAEASIDPAELAKAKTFYGQAALHGQTYYGQLAREKLGLGPDLVHHEVEAASGPARDEAIRAVELLVAAGDRDAADALAEDAARSMDDPRQIAALAAVVSVQQDAHLALTVGKLVGQRGIRIDPLAFPTVGMPIYRPLDHSAPQAMVYAVARQESAFLTRAVSRAGAKGLMQMITSTARRTAIRAGVHFDGARLLHDASFNAQLGAAHLGTLMQGNGGSLILTFAEYNAGGGRVKQWIDAHGDPRKPGIDAIDWVERIPFAETRDYVQRVVANVAVYEAILAEKASMSAEVKTLRVSVAPSVEPQWLPVVAPASPLIEATVATHL